MSRFANVRRASVLGVTAAAACVALLAGCGGGSSAGSTGSAPSPGPTSAAKVSGPTVVLKSLMFNPTTLRVKAGTTVTWRNAEPITHTITSGQVVGVDKTTGLRSDQRPDKRFNGTVTTTGDTFSYTFSQPGTYSYYCSIHQGMNAQVIVSK